MVKRNVKTSREPVFWFAHTVVQRFLKILFQRDRRLRCMYLDYDTEHIFDKSYVIISFRFKNALCYKFGNHWTTENEIKIFDIQNFDNDFTLTAYGFFRKIKKHIRLVPTLSLNTSEFQKRIRLQPSINIPKVEKLSIEGMSIVKNHYVFSGAKIIMNKKFTINHKPFKPSDYL